MNDSFSCPHWQVKDHKSHKKCLKFIQKKKNHKRTMTNETARPLLISRRHLPKRCAWKCKKQLLTQEWRLRQMTNQRLWQTLTKLIGLETASNTINRLRKWSKPEVKWKRSRNASQPHQPKNEIRSTLGVDSLCCPVNWRKTREYSTL